MKGNGFGIPTWNSIILLIFLQLKLYGFAFSDWRDG